MRDFQDEARLSGMIAGLLQNYIQQHGVKGLGYLCHRESKVVLLEDGCVMYTIANPKPAWSKYVRLSDLVTTTELRHLESDFSRMPTDEGMDEALSDALNLLSVRVFERMAIEVAKNFNTPASPLPPAMVEEEKIGQRLPIWKYGLCGLILLSGVTCYFAMHGMPSVWNVSIYLWEKALGTGVGVTALPILIGLFTRFRRLSPVFIALGCCLFAYGYNEYNEAMKSDLVHATSSHAPAQATETWNVTAEAFEATHPELRFGKNTEIMQGNLNRIGAMGVDDDALLSKAYALSVTDPQWLSASSSP